MTHLDWNDTVARAAVPDWLNVAFIKITRGCVEESDYISTNRGVQADYDASLRFLQVSFEHWSLTGAGTCSESIRCMYDIVRDIFCVYLASGDASSWSREPTDDEDFGLLINFDNCIAGIRITNASARVCKAHV